MVNPEMSSPHRLLSLSSSLHSLLLLLLVLTTAVNTQSLPVFTIHPQSSSVKEASSVTLNCALNSSSHNLTIQWMANNTVLTFPNDSYSKNGDSLVISGFESKLNGNYTCLASNEKWTLRSASADIRLGFIESAFDGMTITVTAMKNHSLAIECIPDYNVYPLDKVEIEWKRYFGGDRTNENSYLSLNNDQVNCPIISSNGTLYLLRATEGREYRCRLTSNGDSISYSTVVSVVDASSPSPINPHVIVTPQDVVANKGENAAFNCIAGGYPIPAITWVKPSNSTSLTVKKQEGTQLLVAAVKKSDEGQFTCSASGLSNTYSAMLSIRDPPIFTATPPTSVIVTFGESRTLTCLAAGDEVDVVWYHNGELVSSDTSVTITNAVLSDAGAYQCYATGPVEFVTSSTLVSIQTIAPTFLPNGTLYNQVTFSGKNLTLSCLATGAPEPSYRWTKDGFEAEGFNGFDLSTPGSLIISSIIKPLEGSYSCLVENKLEGQVIGRENSSAMVVVVEPTMLTTVNPESLKSHIGDPFHLNCIVVTHDSMTTVELSWTINGQEIHNSTQLIQTGQKSLRLNITSAMQSDQGIYQCVARTIHTTYPSFLVPEVKSSITTVEITNAPIQPSISQVSAVGPNTLEVSWTYKGFLDNLKEYQIETQVNGYSDWYNHGSFPKSGITIRNVTGLLAYTEYNARVVAVINNEEEEAVPSSAYGPVRTKQDVPSTAPVRIDALINSTSTLSLQWDAPSSRSNGVIIGYTIRYWTNDTRNNTVTEISVGGNSTGYVLTGLAPNTTYWIQVAAHTVAGRGPFSEPFRVVTTPMINRISEEDEAQFYEKIWFILICAVVVLIAVVTLVATIAALRWRSKSKGNKYTVRGGFFAEEISLSEDVVADYNRRREAPLGFSESVDGSRSNLNNTQFDLSLVPPFVRSDSFRESFRGSMRGSLHGSVKGYIPPPEYINPPSFEETLKMRLSSNRSASTSLLDKTNRHQLHGSGWSVGHDPKSAFFLPDPESDSMVDKPRFPDTEEDVSSDTSTGFHSQSATNVESFATFV